MTVTNKPSLPSTAEPTFGYRAWWLVGLVLVFSLSVNTLCINTAGADDLLPPQTPVAEAVDHYIGQRLKENKIKPAPLADDAAFLRRVTLDLAGRVPTLAEREAYLALQDDDKREQLVDRLLTSPDYAFQQANWLDAMLLGGERNEANWQQYLRDAVTEDRPWDQMFREMMLGDDEDQPAFHAQQFLRQRVSNADDMTNDVSRLFFGVSINCAQCHDHPLVEDWKQDHYFGMKSFFDRTYVTKGDRLAEKYNGEVKFKTTDGEEKRAKFMFLTGSAVEEPQVEKSKEQIKKEDEIVKQAMKDKNAKPKPPTFRPREQLVKLALDEGNSHFFARSITNRVWARFMGQGLVTPLDQMHSENPPTHPELLNWLTRDLRANKYRLKRLVRGLVLSETYARSSEWAGEKVPFSDTYAKAPVRVLTPREYSLSLLVATTASAKLPGDMKPADWQKQRENQEKQSQSLAGKLEWPSEHFQVSVDEALLFSNDQRVQNDYLRDSSSHLLGELKAIEDVKQRIRTAFLQVLCREPETDEVAAIAEYLAAREDRSLQALQHIVWTLITSPEFRFNH